MSAKLVKLVSRCIADVGRHPVPNVDVYLGDEITTWHLALRYTDDAPFTGGLGGALRAANFPLYVTMTFSEDFPTRPPRLKFLSPWTNHQHLWGDRICHSLLTDDFQDYFAERRTHGTSMWNAACALADDEGIGGMPRYLKVLWDYLATDLDYEEEQHVKYDETSLQQDVIRQRDFLPDFVESAILLEPALPVGNPGADADAGTSELADTQAALDPAGGERPIEEPSWGTDFFLKSSLVPGDLEMHPCFDVAVSALPGRPPTLSTSMATLCRKSFDMSARMTDFGTPISVVLPYPVSGEAWDSAGSHLAAHALEELSSATDWYAAQLPSVGDEDAALEAVLNAIGELWKTTCISIVKEEGYESERAMMCFITLHFLLLCWAEEHPGLRAHASKTVQEFCAMVDDEPEENLKECVPDLGRFLVRFLLSGADASLKEKAAVVVREVLSRNVRWVPFYLWPVPESSSEQQAEQINASFQAGHFGMKLTLFQSYYILRSAELGLDTLLALRACRGKPPLEALAAFQQDCKAIKALADFPDFFKWLRLDGLTSVDVHRLLCEAVTESEGRGYNSGVRGR